MTDTFRALVARDDNAHAVAYEDLTEADLVEGNVTVDDEFSTLNYKDSLAQGTDLPGSVMPFILRNVRLQGVDPVQAPMVRRQEAWQRLATDLDIARPEALSFDLPFSEVQATAAKILSGQVRQSRC